MAEKEQPQEKVGQDSKVSQRQEGERMRRDDKQQSVQSSLE